MKTIKVEGGGPLVGKVFYGEELTRKDSPFPLLVLDEPPFPGEFRTSYAFNRKTGYMIGVLGEMDLLRIVP